MNMHIGVRLYVNPSDLDDPGKQAHVRFENVPESALDLPLEDFMRLYGTGAFHAILQRLKARK